MLTLLSPAKKLLSSATPYLGETTQPLFFDKTLILAELMKTKSIHDLAQLMKLSPDLSLLNYERYQRFSLEKVDCAYSYPALFLFQGDVYQGLQAGSWDVNAVNFSQSHLGILSGLYGLLRPLDRIQHYRLEMGVHLANPSGKNLYEFWREPITKTLNQHLAQQENPVLINLASTEYVQVVDKQKLNYPMVTINFYEQKNHELKMIGIYAKKARGVMAKFIMQHSIDDLEQLKSFNELGYVYQPQSSSSNHLDFIRIHS